MVITRAASQPLSFRGLGRFNTITRVIVRPSKALHQRSNHHTSGNSPVVPEIETSTFSIGKLLEDIGHAVEKYPSSEPMVQKIMHALEIYAAVTTPKVPFVKISTSPMRKMLGDITCTMKKHLCWRWKKQQAIIHLVKKYAGPVPIARQDSVIGSLARLVEAKCERPENLARSQKRTFLYYQVKDEDLPSRCVSKPKDLEECFNCCLSQDEGLIAPIPIMRAGHQYLIASSGHIYRWEELNGTVWKMMQPNTLKDLLDLANLGEFVYEDYDLPDFTSIHGTQWVEIETRRDNCLPEHEY